jgi:hypothetical protein
MGVTVGKYHLFKKTRQSSTYYYYWYKEGKERVFKSCGKACTEKREAVVFLEQLLKEELTETKRKSSRSSITINDFANMFIEGAPHLSRWAAKGKVLKQQTIAQH